SHIARRSGGSDEGGAGRDRNRRGGHDARRAPRAFRMALEPQAVQGQETTVKKLAVALGVALVGLVLFPGVAHAWTPGTHIFLGESVLANLHQIPTLVADF